MFCYQCEQTAKGEGCTSVGVCGKSPETAALQDLLVHAMKGVANYAHRAGKLGATDAALNRFTVEALFSTLTNVNFDSERFVTLNVTNTGSPTITSALSGINPAWMSISPTLYTRVYPAASAVGIGRLNRSSH